MSTIHVLLQVIIRIVEINKNLLAKLGDGLDESPTVWFLPNPNQTYNLMGFFPCAKSIKVDQTS